MSEDTLRKKKNWIAQHYQKVVGGGLIAILSYLGTYLFEGFNDVEDRMARMETSVQEMEQRELENIWRTMYILREDVDENKIEIGVMRKLAEIVMSSGEAESLDARALMDSLGALIDETEDEFNPAQIQEFRNVQQKAYGPPGGK